MPMSSEPEKKPDDPSKQPNPTGVPGQFTQEFQHSQVSALVPEKVKRGVFSTGALILQGQHEFVIDFALRIAQPHQIAARVVLPPSIMPHLITALRENFANYQSRFGPPPPLPVPPTPPKPPSIEEIYEQLKLSEEWLNGVYANAVMIVHTPTEFCFDFITTFYPRSAVSCRVFLAAPQIPGFLNSLTSSYQQYQQKTAGGQAPKPPEMPPPAKT
jgi:hypothetical protein